MRQPNKDELNSLTKNQTQNTRSSIDLRIISDMKM